MYLLFLFFSLISMVALATVKDGEHDKTHMVNKLTFNNAYPLKIPPTFRYQLNTRGTVPACMSTDSTDHPTSLTCLQTNHRLTKSIGLVSGVGVGVNGRRFINSTNVLAVGNVTFVHLLLYSAGMLFEVFRLCKVKPSVRKEVQMNQDRIKEAR